MKNSHLIIIVLTNRKDPWARIHREGAEATWIFDSKVSAKILKYIGRLPTKSEQVRESITGRLRHGKLVNVQRGFDRLFSGLFRLSLNPDFVSGNTIVQPYPELHSTIGLRTLSAFNTVLNDLDWQYLWRANASNYVNTEALLLFLRDASPEKFAGGVINFYQGEPYLSGAGYCLSRDVVQRIVERPELWDHSVLDDVSLGRVLNQIDVALTEIPRLTFTERSQVHAVKIDTLKKTPSFRCNGVNDRQKDIEIMNSLHERLCEVAHDLGHP
jgi:hypothetical protein